MKIFQPSSPDEFDAYYQLRWEILRAPWRQPKGSEKDEYEDTAFHVMAVNDDGAILGVGRLHPVDSNTAQIRYMAVSEQAQHQGIGGKILHALEQQARRENVVRLVLNARDSTLDFYRHHGYHNLGKGHTLFGHVAHTMMQKNLYE